MIFNRRVGIVEDAETDHIINQLAQKQIGDEDLHRLQEQSGKFVIEFRLFTFFKWHQLKLFLKHFLVFDLLPSTRSG